MGKEHPGLRPVLAGKEPQFDLYRMHLLGAIERFKVDTRAFSSGSRERTIEAAIRLFSGMQIEPDFFQNQESSLYMLAIADRWIYLDQQSGNQPFEEKAGLVNLVKGLACGENITHSLRVRKASAAGSVLGKLFDPANRPNPDEEVNAAMDQKIIYAIRDHTDTDASLLLKQRLQAIGPSTLLHNIRAFAKRVGEPINAVVLNLTTDEMIEQLDGFMGGFGKVNGEKVLVVGKDASDQTIQHESIHYLLEDIRDGFFMNGLMEAWTDEHTQQPESYIRQRDILAHIYSHYPDIALALDNAFRDTSRKAKKRFLTLVTAALGLRGLLALGRLDAQSYEAYRMGLTPEEVEQELKEIEEERDTRKTSSSVDNALLNLYASLRRRTNL